MTVDRDERSVRDVLQVIWEEVLEVNGIGFDESFFDLGGDSILALHIATRCQSFGLAVTPALLLQNDTVATLTDALCGRASLPESVDH